MGYRHLSIDEREQISRGLAKDLTLREIGRRLGRSASTITREVKRNARADYCAERGYLACEAQRLARRRRRSARRPCKLARPGWLRGYVLRGLRRRWSPQQIGASAKIRSRAASSTEIAVIRGTDGKSSRKSSRDELPSR